MTTVLRLGLFQLKLKFPVFISTKDQLKQDPLSNFIGLKMGVTDINVKLISSCYSLCYCRFSELTVTARFSVVLKPRVNIKILLTRHVISLIAQARIIWANLSRRIFKFFTTYFILSDYLKITNEKNHTFGDYCGVKDGFHVIVTGDYVVLKFHSDCCDTRPGYLLSFNAFCEYSKAPSTLRWRSLKTKLYFSG